MRLPRSARHWLLAHSALYRRWIRWRFRRSAQRLERTMGRKLSPTLKRTAAAMRAWQKAWDGPTTEEETP